MDPTLDPIHGFVGIDVGKEAHFAVALDRAGQRLLSRSLPSSLGKLRALLTELAQVGSVVVAVDQPASIGALVVAVAQAMAIPVGYLPGLRRRRLADLYPGEAKTDARDAWVIAETARTLPQALRALSPPGAQPAGGGLGRAATAVRR